MALIGTYIDVIAASFAGGSVAAQTYATLQHSLGAAPNFVIPQLASMGACSAAPQLVGVGGNASIATIGLLTPSGFNNVASSPVVGFSAICWRVHSYVS